MKSSIAVVALALTRYPSGLSYGEEFMRAADAHVPEDVEVVSVTWQTDWIARVLFPLFMRPSADARTADELGVAETARVDFTFECESDLRYQRLPWLDEIVKTTHARFQIAASYLLYVLKSPRHELATHFRLTTTKRSNDSDDDAGVRPSQDIARLLDHHLYGTGPTVSDHPLLAKLILLEHPASN